MSQFMPTTNNGIGTQIKKVHKGENAILTIKIQNEKTGNYSCVYT